MPTKNKPNLNKIATDESKAIQQKTIQSLHRTKAQLTQTNELASQTRAELRNQRQQVEQVVASENERLENALAVSKKLQNKFDFWQFRWGGRDRRLAKKEGRDYLNGQKRYKGMGRFMKRRQRGEENDFVSDIEERYDVNNGGMVASREKKGIGKAKASFDGAPLVVNENRIYRDKEGMLLDDDLKRDLRKIEQQDDVIDDMLDDIDQSLDMLTYMSSEMNEETNKTGAGIDAAGEIADKNTRRLHALQKRMARR